LDFFLIFFSIFRFFSSFNQRNESLNRKVFRKCASKKVKIPKETKKSKFRYPVENKQKNIFFIFILSHSFSCPTGINALHFWDESTLLYSSGRQICLYEIDTKTMEFFKSRSPPSSEVFLSLSLKFYFYRFFVWGFQRKITF